VQKDTWGCTDPVRQPYPLQDEPPIGLCPLRAFKDQPDLEAYSFSLHRHWSNGILPAQGGLAEQPANYENVILATDTGLALGQSALQEISQRKADRQNRKKNRA